MQLVQCCELLVNLPGQCTLHDPVTDWISSSILSYHKQLLCDASAACGGRPPEETVEEKGWYLHILRG